MTKLITLKKNERYFLGNKYFLIKKGKIISRDILENGKIVSRENCLKSGEIIGNFFLFMNNDDFFVPNIEIEIEALEDNTILEEFFFISNFNLQNSYFEKLVLQLVKTSLIKFFFHLYDAKGYILILLKLYADEEGKILKKEIKYENFNVSRSQFYLIYSQLKKNKFIIEKNKIIYLNLNLINKYLKKLQI